MAEQASRKTARLEARISGEQKALLISIMLADARELGLSLLQPGVAAGLRASALTDVAHVHDKGELLCVHLVDDAVELLNFRG